MNNNLKDLQERVRTTEDILSYVQETPFEGNFQSEEDLLDYLDHYEAAADDILDDAAASYYSEFDY